MKFNQTVMKVLVKLFSVATMLLLISSCNCSQKSITVEVTNSLNIERNNQTVQVDLGQLGTELSNVIVVDKSNDKEVLSQMIDSDGDNVFEAIIFQTSIGANKSKEFLVKEGESGIKASEVRTFARFVPERTDDFTWENDRVAFRVYGPEAQRLNEVGDKSGTLSGGVDCWLKKVDYSIIDKWYKGNTENPGYYHKDHGEGLDNYHVGPSCGSGGTGVMVDGNLYPHVNYTGYKVLANGPIKTEFDLEYAAYQAGEMTIKEKKTLSIDLGSNFTKFVIEVEGTDTLTAGITLHDNLGEISVNEKSAWASYWSPHFGEELGNSLVADPKYYAGYSHIESDVKDKSHLLVHLKVIDGKVEFYSGFAWSGSKQFENKQSWEKHLSQFSNEVVTPLIVKVK